MTGFEVDRKSGGGEIMTKRSDFSQNGIGFWEISRVGWPPKYLQRGFVRQLGTQWFTSTKWDCSWNVVYV